MKMDEAESIIQNHEAYVNKPKGYRVHFEKLVNTKFLETDYVPGDGEPMITTQSEAWELAKRLAAATKGKCFNFYVVDQHWHPVADYEKRKIKNR